jgi:phospholipid transport system substrate-binding protein
MRTALDQQRSIPSRRGPFRAVAMAVALLVSTAFPALAEHPTAFMQRVANELIAAQRASGGPAFAAVLRRHADVPWLGQSALGSYAHRLATAERPNYYNGMIKFISNYAAKEAPKYLVNRATVMSATAEGSTGVYVDTVVELRTGETYDVRWWLGRQGTTFKIRDAQVVGFWMSPFLKNLFENYITENGGNPLALVVALNR